MPDYGYRPSQNFERVLRDAEDQMEKARELKERMAEVVGRGEAADGRISAEFRQQGGLTALDLDPRVLRLSADELSLEIRTAVNAAAQDYQTKAMQVGGELFGGSGEGAERLTDARAAMAQMEKLGDGFARQMKEVLQELTVQQQRTRGAMGQIRDPRRTS
jgi:DNA-binding protein YbaB